MTDHIKIQKPLSLSQRCVLEYVDGGHCYGDTAAIVVAIGSINHTQSLVLCGYHRQELRYKLGKYMPQNNEKGTR
jgi:hypothetical protein